MFRDLEPPGLAVQRAIRWIGQERRSRPVTDTVKLVDEASRRFDLTPTEEEFLLQLLTVKV
ncbi:MAG: hypothetical protein ACK4YP_22410 [Myxococcota bacterium]